eukprot:scaffold3917_cov377-Prasinococcus_capsulatus_cf.AAC.9
MCVGADCARRPASPAAAAADVPPEDLAAYGKGRGVGSQPQGGAYPLLRAGVRASMHARTPAVAAPMAAPRNALPRERRSAARATSGAEGDSASGRA